jgi:hypothetical protein
MPLGPILVVMLLSIFSFNCIAYTIKINFPFIPVVAHQINLELLWQL